MKERLFIAEKKKELMIKEFIMEKYSHAKPTDVKVIKVPGGIRLVIFCLFPGHIIGQKGSGINKLSKQLEENFGIKDVQIDVQKIANPYLDPNAIAQRIAENIERGYSYKRLGRYFLQKAMDAGAIGCEIIIKGKVGGEKARKERFAAGYIIKSGRYFETKVYKGEAKAMVKLGLIQIKVMILLENPDRIVIPEKEAVDDEKPEAERAEKHEEGGAEEKAH